MVENTWPTYGNPDLFDAHGVERLAELVHQLRPAIVLMLNDLWFCAIHAPQLKRMPHRPMTVAYCPVDGVLTNPTLYSNLGLFDQVVAYNSFGREQLESIRFNGAPLGKNFVSRQIDIVPHGIAHNLFYKLEPYDLLDRSQTKRLVFGQTAQETDFVVLNASKNDSRKCIEVTLGGFARFARDKPKGVKLYLHMAATGGCGDVRERAHQAGIGDRLIMTDGCLHGHPSVDDSQLNMIYNATDVGINTSCGEAWGLVSFEHAATGAPQVVPAHSGCTDIWNTIETRLPTRRVAEDVVLGMRREFVAENDVAAVLERLYQDERFRREQALKAYRVAQKPEYSWPRIAEQWDQIFQNMLAKSVGTRPEVQFKKEEM